MKKTFLLSVFLFLAFAITSCDNESDEGSWHKFEEIGYPRKESVFQGTWVDVQGNISVITATTINIVSETINFDFQLSDNSRYRYPVSHLGDIYQIKDGDFFLEMEVGTSVKILLRYNGEEIELTKQ